MEACDGVDNAEIPGAAANELAGVGEFGDADEFPDQRLARNERRSARRLKSGPRSSTYERGGRESMLSWTFVAAMALLAVLPPRLPARVRALALAGLSLGAIALIWHVPVVALVAASLAVYAIASRLPALAPATRRWVLGGSIAAIVSAFVVLKLASGGTVGLVTTTSVVGFSYFSLKFIQHLVDAGSGRTRNVDLPAFLCTSFTTVALT